MNNKLIDYKKKKIQNKKSEFVGFRSDPESDLLFPEADQRIRIHIHKNDADPKHC